MTNFLSFRNQLALVVVVTLIALGMATPTKKFVFFHHNSIPSNLYVNAAQGPSHIKDDPDGKTDIIRLLLYPTDKKSRAPKTAKAVVNSKSIYGLVTLRQDRPPTGPTFIAGVMKGLTPGEHGINIFEYGDIEADCLAVGSVYDPYKVDPASLPVKRKIGELGTISADETGTARFGLTDTFVSLVGPRSVIGRAIVVTSVSRNESAPAVERRGCGVIGYAG